MDKPRESLQELVREFQGAGYAFRDFTEEPAGRDVFLRHDIDFSLEAAVEVAQIESDLGVRATYFFMLSTSFYNLLAEESQSRVAQVRALGHTVSIHYDPTAHSDIDSGFNLERELFERLFSIEVEVVSLHRPQGFLDNNNRRLPGVRHTYEDRYFRHMHYISDSKGAFGHGHPLESEAFREGRPIHLLLHPIWWVTAGSTPSEKLRNWERGHHAFLLGEMARNCGSFDGRSGLCAE